MKNRLVLSAIVLAAFLALVVALAQCAPGRLARITPTPTRTLRPTFTPTSEASHTPLPSPTPFATQTSTAAPPTDTSTPVPEPTAAAVEPTSPPTNTPTPWPPTATATRKPAATRTKTPTPKPTNTPVPPFKGSIVHGWAKCDLASVTGYVYHADKSPYVGVGVGVWSDAWDGAVSITESSGKFEVLLGGMPPGTYYVAVVDTGTCPGTGARGCQQRSNVVNTTLTQSCSGAGANQVTEIRFDGP